MLFHFYWLSFQRYWIVHKLFLSDLSSHISKLYFISWYRRFEIRCWILLLWNLLDLLHHHFVAIGVVSLPIFTLLVVITADFLFISRPFVVYLRLLFALYNVRHHISICWNNNKILQNIFPLIIFVVSYPLFSILKKCRNKNHLIFGCDILITLYFLICHHISIINKIWICVDILL